MAMLAASEEYVTTIPEALVNTAIGMGTVFIVLILISFIIYLLGKVPALLEGAKKAKQETQPAAAPKPAPTIQAAPKAAPVPKAAPTAAAPDQTQLVAVITAAVAAAMEQEGTPVPADGLVIRSIKKRF